MNLEGFLIFFCVLSCLSADITQEGQGFIYASSRIEWKNGSSIYAPAHCVNMCRKGRIFLWLTLYCIRIIINSKVSSEDSHNFASTVAFVDGASINGLTLTRQLLWNNLHLEQRKRDVTRVLMFLPISRELYFRSSLRYLKHLLQLSFVGFSSLWAGGCIAAW